ncbi:TVP38/TMEM64 family protein [Oceanomicrobium pacificus]|nr:VTT domain-containing protein [Oceanomicrobium pacificus]
MVPILVILAVAVIGYLTLGDRLSYQTLAENHERLTAWRDAHFLTVLLAYMGLYVVVVGFSLPGGAPLTLAGGFLFGVWVAAPATVVAATLGATLIFLAAKTGLGDMLREKLTGDGAGLFARIERGVHENEVSYLLLIRLVPVVPFWLANLAPAFLGVGLRNFVLTTFFGIIPGTFVYAWVGSGLGALLDRGEAPDLGIIFEWQILGPILGLCALSALPILIKALRRGKEA